MASILRGETYWANLDPTQGYEQSGWRRVLVLSEDIFNARSRTVIAVALTSQEPRADFPLTWVIVGTGLPKRSWANISQIRTRSTQRLGGKVGEATAQEVATVLEGLNEILAVDAGGGPCNCPFSASPTAAVWHLVCRVHKLLVTSLRFLGVSVIMPTGNPAHCRGV